MDLNIGAALWLAARAHGTLRLPTFSDRPTAPLATPISSSSHGQVYRSCARVVLLGHGADEVFAGYSRHRTAFRVGGLPRLQAELELDMHRLWLRNLGRDDRLVADCSRESRHPFLDEALLEAVAAIPLAAVADLERPAGEGDKAILRGVAQRLGLVRAASRVKRAIQFGSRIGKQSNVRDFGSNRAANKMHAGMLAVRTCEQLGSSCHGGH